MSAAETVCRVCLVQNLNLYGVQNHLQSAYEIITREKYNKVGYPVSMCYICLSMLKKMYKFMETARDTDNMLKQWYKHHNEVEIGVAKPLKIYSVSKIELVYMGAKHATLTHGIKTEAADTEDVQPHSKITQTVRAMENEDLSSKLTIKIEPVDLEEVQPVGGQIPSMKSIENKNTSISLRQNMEKERHLEPVGIIDTMECMEYEETSLENDMKMEEVDLKTDYIECDTEVNIEVAAMNEQIDNNGSSMVDSPYEDTTRTNDDIHAKSFIYNKDIEKRSSLASNVNVHTNVEIRNKTKSQCNNENSENNNADTTNEVRPEVEKNDVLQFLSAHEIPKDLNTEIKIEEIYENDTDNLVTETSNINVNLNTDVIITPINKQKPEEKSKTFIFCNECNFKCVAKSVLIVHLRRHTGEKPFCAKKGNLKKHNGENQGSRQYSCKFCKYRCARKSYLKMHSRKHTGDKPFTCEICDYRCALKSQLRKHLKIHSDDKPFSCTICDFRSIKKYSIIEHLRMHTGDKPFSCNICEFKCATKSYLTIHLRKHTGDKPYSCTFCNYKSTRKGHLTEHLRMHTGEKPFSCKFCEYKCIRSSDLNKHTKSHDKPLLCNFCEYKCATKPLMTQHLLKHTDEQPFKCKHCPTRFKRSSCLKNHTAKFHHKNNS